MYRVSGNFQAHYTLAEKREAEIASSNGRRRADGAGVKEKRKVYWAPVEREREVGGDELTPEHSIGSFHARLACPNVLSCPGTFLPAESLRREKAAGKGERERRTNGSERHARSFLHGNGRGVGVKMGMNVEMGVQVGVIFYSRRSWERADKRIT